MYYLFALIFKLILFILLTQVSHKVILVFIVSALLGSCFLMMLYKNSKKYTHQITFGYYAFISLLMFVDVLYFTYFNRLITFSVHSQLVQLPGVLQVVSFFLNQKVLLFIIDLPFLIYYFYKNKSFYLKPLKNQHYYLKLIPMIILIIFIQITNLETVQAYEFFTYHTSDLLKQIIRKDDDEIHLSQTQYNQFVQNNKLIQGPLTGIAKGKNVIMIQVEALQALAINLKIQNHEITPNLNQLIKEQGSLYFDNIFQNVGRGNTADAEFAALNSLYPSSSEIIYETYAQNDFYAFPELLKEKGYRTAYFHANHGSFYNREMMSKALGFDEFYELADFKFKQEDIISYGLNDVDFFEQALYRLKYLDKKYPEGWMAFLISISSHTPFNLTPEQKTLVLDNPNNNLALKYFEAVHYADAALGQFIENLKTNGLYDQSMIVIYGDHFGLNSLNEDTKDAMEEALNRDYFIDDMFNVPLLIHIPNTQINQTIHKLGSQVDIYPTLNNLLGIENQKGIMFGQDLINSEKENVAFPMFFITENSFINQDYIFMASRDQTTDFSKLYDRHTHELLDPNLVANQLESNYRHLYFSQQIIKQDLFRKFIKH